MLLIAARPPAVLSPPLPSVPVPVPVLAVFVPSGYEGTGWAVQRWGGRAVVGPRALAARALLFPHRCCDTGLGEVRVGRVWTWGAGGERVALTSPWLRAGGCCSSQQHLLSDMAKM